MSKVPIQTGGMAILAVEDLDMVVTTPTTKIVADTTTIMEVEATNTIKRDRIMAIGRI